MADLVIFGSIKLKLLLPEDIEKLENLKCCNCKAFCSGYINVENHSNINCWNVYIIRTNDPESKLYIGYVYINESEEFEFHCSFCDKDNII